MTTTIGDLYLELGLDPSKYYEQLEQARLDAITIGRAIEQSLKAGKLDLKLTPQVDDRQLTNLNKHFDKKDKHAESIQRKWDRKPLTPKVDFKFLNELDRKLDQIERRSVRVSVGGSVSSASTGSVSSSRGGNGDRALADQIGQAVARHSKQRGGLFSKAVGAVGDIALSPIKASKRVIGGVLQGAAIGLGSEISKNLGVGVSRAIESTLSKSLGSSELVGEKIGGVIVGSIATSVNKRFFSVPEQLNKAIDKLDVKDRVKRKLRDAVKEIEKVQTQLKESTINTLGGQETIVQEGLYQRGVQRKAARRKAPVAQETSAEEWRQALRDQDKISGRAKQRFTTASEQLKVIAGEYEQARKEYVRINRAIKTAEESESPNEDLQQLVAELRIVGATMQSLSDVAENLNNQKKIAMAAMQEAKKNVNQSFNNYKSVTPKDNNPKSYTQLFKQATKGHQVSSDKMPELVLADAELEKAGAISQYDPARNKIQVSKKVMKQLQSGDTSKTLGDLGLVKQDSIVAGRTIAEVMLEEIQHSIDAEFGSFKGLQSFKKNEVVGGFVPYSNDEFGEFAQELGAYNPERRALELNAKVQARRNVSDFQQQQNQQALLKIAPNLMTAKPLAAKLMQRIENQINEMFALAQEAGVDITTNVEKYATFADSFNNRINSALDGLLQGGLDEATLNEISAKIAADIDGLQTGLPKLIQSDIGKLKQRAATKQDESRQQMRDLLPQFNRKKTLIPLAQEMGLEDVEQLNKKQLIDRLVSETDINQLQPRVHDLTRAKAQQDLARQERLQNIAQGAGKTAKGAITTVQAVVDSPQFQAFSRGTKAATGAMVQIAKVGYNVASGLESVALDLVPMGRTIKGIAQQTAVPAAIFMGASAMLPGGGAMAEGLTHLAGGALSPLAHAATTSLSGSATSALAGLPQFAGIQATITGMVTGAIESAISGATAAVAPAMVAVLGGKAIQTAVTTPIKGIAAATTKPTIKGLPAAKQELKQIAASPELQQQPLLLPDINKVKEMAAIELAPKPELKKLNQNKQGQQALQQAKQTAQKAGEFTRSVVDATQNTIATAGNVSKTALEEVKRIETAFAGLYKGLKAAIDSGDAKAVEQRSAAIPAFVKEYQGKINQLIKEVKTSGDNQFGSEALTKLGGLKGRLTQKQKLATREVNQFKSQRMKQAEVPNDAIDVWADASGSDLTAQMKVLDDAANLLGVSSEKLASVVKDLAVNTAGFAASKALEQYGIVPQLAGDLGGALVARNAINAGVAGHEAYQGLKTQDVFKAASALQKFTMLLQEASRVMQSEQFQSMQGDELFGDITGFQVGNLVAQLPNLMPDLLGSLGGVPLKGAGAAMLAVPQLQKLRGHLANTLVDESQGEDLNAQMLGLRGMELFSRKGLNPSKQATTEQRVLIEHVIELLDSAIDANARYEEAVKRVSATVTQEYEKSAKAAEKALNPDFDELNKRVEERIKDIDNTVAELDKNYADRTNTAQSKLQEDLEYRQAYAEATGMDFEGMDFTKIPSPPKEGNNLWKDLFKAIKGDGEDAISGLMKFGKTAKLAIVGLLGVAILHEPIQMLAQFGNESLQTAQAVQSLAAKSTFAFGSIESGSKALKFAADSADKYRTNILQASNAYIQFASATKGTALQGFGTETLFKGSQAAALGMQMKPEEVERFNVSLQQMASKSKLSAEEVRGQMSEVLPGSFSILARAIGVTEQELNGMMERGELLAEDVLPKLGAQLQAEMGLAAMESANTAAAAITNLENQVFKLQTAVGTPLLPAQKLGLDVLAAGVQMLTVALPELIKLLAALAAGYLLSLAASAIVTSRGMITTAKAMVLLNNAGIAFGAAWKGIKGFFGQSALGVAGFTLAIYAAVYAIDRLNQMYFNAGKQSKDFARTAKEGLRQYQEELAKLHNVDIPTPTKPGRDTGNTALPGFLGTLERGIQGAFAKADERQGTNPNHRTITWGELEGQQQTIAESDAMQAGRGIQEAMRSQLTQLKGIAGVSKGGQGEINQIQDINSELRTLQFQRMGLRPGDVQGRRAIEQREEGLRRQLEPLQRTLGTASMQNSAYIEYVKGQRQSALERFDLKAFQEWDTELKQSQQLQDEYNSAIQIGIGAFANLTLALAESQGSFEQLNREIDRAAAREKKTIAGMQVAGATTGELEGARNNMDIAQMGQKLQANQTAINEALSAMQTPDMLRALNAIGFDSVDAAMQGSNPGAIRERANQMSDSEAKNNLTTFADQFTRVEDMKSEVANLDAQIAEAKAQAITRLRDLTTQTYEFYRNIANQSKDLSLQLEKAQLQAKTQHAQNALRSTLIGFQDSFINDFVESLVSMVESLNKPLDDAINAQQQILQAQQQYFQSIQQAYSLNQQMPTELQAGTLLPAGTSIAGENGLPTVTQIAGNGAIVGQTNNTTSYAGQTIADPHPVTPYGVVENQTMGLSPLALLNQNDLTSIQQQLIDQGVIQPATTAPTAGTNAAGAIGTAAATTAPTANGMPALSVPLDDPRAYQQQQDALRQLDPTSAVQAGNNAIQQGARTAYDNYQTQVSTIQTTLAASQETANLEASMSMDRADRALWQAGRQMEDTARGFNRSLADLTAQGQQQTPFVQLQGQMRGLNNQFEDTMRGMEDFRRGLQDTIDQAGMMRDFITEGLANGSLPEQFRDMLPGLDAIAAQAQERLSRLMGEAEAYNRAFLQAAKRAQIEYNRQQKQVAYENKRALRQVQNDIKQAQSQAATLDRNPDRARVLDAEVKGSQLGESFVQRMKDLEQLRYEGKLTADQFNEMATNLRQLNTISLSNLTKEIKNAADENVISALTAKPQNNAGQQSRELENIRYQAVAARNRGFISEEQYNQIGDATRQIGARLSNDPFQLAQLTRNNQDNPFFAQIMNQIGRSDVMGLANLASPQSVNAAINAAQQANAAGVNEGNTYDSSFTAAVEPISRNLTAILGRIDSLITVTKAASARPNLTVNSNQGVSDAGKIYADIAVKSANL